MSYKHKKDHYNYHRRYRLEHREKMNEQNKIARRNKGKIPREIWVRLLKDRQVWVSQHNGLPKRDHAAWRALLHEKAKVVDLDLIPDRCVDCEILFAEHPRCSRNPDYCRGCWGERYIKKQAKNKESLLYNPARMV